MGGSQARGPAAAKSAAEPPSKPFLEEVAVSEDPFYSLPDLAEGAPSLGNPQIDEAVYGE